MCLSVHCHMLSAFCRCLYLAVGSGAAALWLDTWSLTELLACARLKTDRKDFLVEPDQVSERFRLFGGIPRFVLKQADATVEDAMQKFMPGDETDLLNVRLFGSRTSMSHRLVQARVCTVPRETWQLSLSGHGGVWQGDRFWLAGGISGCVTHPHSQHR